jgi:outer membrane protein TolC
MDGIPDRGQMIAAAVTSFRLGEASLTDLLDTLRAALQAEETALDLHASALDAHRQLERLAGRSLELADGTTPEREDL